MASTSRTGAESREVWHRPFVKEHQRWCDDFVLELRLRDVPGTVIGERLGEVEAHCADTGETPAAAFGDPTAYARQLDDDRSPELATGAWRVAINSAIQVLALLVGTAAAFAWARDEQLSYNLVQVGATAVFVAVVLALPVLLRPLVERPWAVGTLVFGLAFAAAIGAVAAGRLELPAVLTLPPAPVTVALFVLVVALAVVGYRELAKDDDGDLVTSPLAPAPESPTSRPRRRLTALLPSALIPVGYVVLSAVPWLLA